jgi:hypothetical protein
VQATFGNHPILTTVVTQTDTYDGGGAGVKRVTLSQTNSNPALTTVSYYLRSTVLGGVIVSEYDAQGLRRTTNVWAGGDVIARQDDAETQSARLVWQRTNPVTGDGRETDAAGWLTAQTHQDSRGVDIGESDPFIDPAVDQSEVGGTGASHASIDARVAQLIPGYGGAQCRLEGFLLGCGFFQSMIASGLVGAGSSEPNVLTIYNNRTHRYVGLAVWDPAAAAMGVDFFRDGHGGYLPAGVSYHSHSGVPFGGPGWSPQWQEYVNYAWADRWEKDKWDEPTSMLTARNIGSFVPDGTASLADAPQRNVTPILNKIRFLGDKANDPKLKSLLQERIMLLLSKGCAEAFKRAGLATPEEIINKGITIADRPLLDDSSIRGGLLSFAFL